MDLGSTEDQRAQERASALDRLFQGDDADVLAPELDAHDEDVVDLEVVRSGFFPAVVDEAEPETAELNPPIAPLADETAATEQSVELSAQPRVVRRKVQAATESRAPRSRSERLLFGLLAVNSLLVGALLLLPGLFGAQQPDPDPHGVASAVPASETRPDRSRVVPPTVGSEASEGAAIADHDVYESAQAWIGRGHYDRATAILTNYLKAHPDLSPIQAQAIYSSLAYCAEQLEDAERAAFYTKRVRDARLRAATAADLLAEAAQAADPATRRALRARLLLRRADPKTAEACRRAADGRTVIADTYRLEARSEEGKVR